MLAFASGDALLVDSGSLVEKAVGVNHVVNNATLADLLGFELPLGRQVSSIVVAQVVVRSDGERLDTGIDEELGENRLEFRLSRLQVVTTDERLVALGKLDRTRNKGVLGGTIDERLAFEDGRNREESGR